MGRPAENTKVMKVGLGIKCVLMVNMKKSFKHISNASDINSRIIRML